MPDPVAVKNANRTLKEHRIEDIQFRMPGAYLTCACGWTITFIEDKDFEPLLVEYAWNAHKKAMGVRS